MSRDEATSAPQSHHADPVTRAAAFIDAHRGPVCPSLLAVAAFVGASPFALHKAFREAMGMSRLDYYRQRTARN